MEHASRKQGRAVGQRAWTPKDVARLRKLAKENTSTRSIGTQLGRSEEAVLQRAEKERISLKAPKPYAHGLQQAPAVRRGKQSVPSTPLAELRSKLHFSRSEFSRVLGFSERAVANWESGKQPLPPAAMRHFEQLRRLYAALCRLMQESAVRAWLLSPNEMLNGLKPIEVIDRGETDRLWNLLYQLESGTPM